MEENASTSCFRLRATGVVYRHDMPAPKILVQARGRVARRLLDLAAEHGIPVVKNPDLSYALSLVPEDFEIPFDLYEAMARLLAGLENT